MKLKRREMIGNFYFEIIIVILFFSIAAVIVTKLYVNLAYTNQVNKLKTSVINNASSVIEVYKVKDSLDNSLEMVFGNKVKSNKKDDKYCIYLNEEMEYAKKGNIKLIITESNEDYLAGRCKKISLSYVYNNLELYVIEGKKYEKK